MGSPEKSEVSADVGSQLKIIDGLDLNKTGETEDLLLDLLPDLSLQNELADTVILGSFLGKRLVSKSFLRTILNNIWATWRGYKIEELKKEVFMFRFKNPNHCRAIWAKRPWNFAGGHLIMKEWPAK